MRPAVHALVIVQGHRVVVTEGGASTGTRSPVALAARAGLAPHLSHHGPLAPPSRFLTHVSRSHRDLLYLNATPDDGGGNNKREDPAGGGPGARRDLLDVKESRIEASPGHEDIAGIAPVLS